MSDDTRLGFFGRLSTATKAVLATAVIGLPEFPTIVTAAVAAAGIGTMPPEADLQRAIVQCSMALIAGLLVYQMPNATPGQVLEKKQQANNPIPEHEPVPEPTPLRPRPRPLELEPTPVVEVAHS